MTVIRWTPARELAAMEIDRLNRMFDSFLDRGLAQDWEPRVDILETPDHEYVLKAELPELKREDISITFANHVLTLSGERKAAFDANAGTLHRSERPYGAFSRSFSLPATVDGPRIGASYKDGVLTVRLPQREEAKPKQIQIED